MASHADVGGDSHEPPIRHRPAGGMPGKLTLAAPADSCADGTPLRSTFSPTPSEPPMTASGHPTGIGVDGCPAGWVAVRVGGGRAPEVDVFPSVEVLHRRWDGPDHLFLIDVPIGLPDTESHRPCDRAARAYLGRRASSVFNPPTRAALDASTYREAADRNASACGKRLSRQSWGIVPRVREVDVFLRADPSRQRRLREAHPETLFQALNGGATLVHTKKDPAGQEERLRIVERLVPGARELCARARRTWPRRDVRPDDVLDALVAAAVASRLRDGLSTLPPDPEPDALGLVQEMVVPTFAWCGPGTHLPAGADTGADATPEDGPP